MTTEIINKKISPIIEKAQEIKIKDSETLELASDFRSKLKAEEKRLKEDKESLTKPINESLKQIRMKYKPAEDIIEQALQVLNGKMSEYQMEVIRKAKEEADKIASRIGEGKGKLSVEKAMEKMADLAPVEAPSKTGFRIDYALEIVSEKDIPREYLTPMESIILRDLKAGHEVAGCKLKEVLIPVNKTR